MSLLSFCAVPLALFLCCAFPNSITFSRNNTSLYFAFYSDVEVIRILRTQKKNSCLSGRCLQSLNSLFSEPFPSKTPNGTALKSHAT